MNVVWTIAGSNSAGFSGIQADFITLRNLNTHACSVITAVTAQHYNDVQSIYYLNDNEISAQINALHDTLPAKSIKIGMLGKVSIINLLKNYFSKHSRTVILDPIMISTSGKNLFFDNLNNYVTSLKSLLPFITLVTPNIHEAELLAGHNISTFTDMEHAAYKILSFGAKNVLIKGGHFEENNFSQDFWSDGKESCWLSTKRSHQKKIRGTGCILSSSIAAYLAQGFNIKDSLIQSKILVHKAIQHDQHDLPTVSIKPLTTINQAFPSCDGPLGLYPVVDSVTWLETLLPLGVRTIQLRLKNKTEHELDTEIHKSICLAKQFNARLFINDYWELAIKHGAYGIHLGQEDLDHADIEKIRNTGLRLGISTHSYYEIARANTIKPSYIAIGPIFETTSKLMPFAPQGLDKLALWCHTLDYPIVAIGGINTENILSVINTGVDGIAMISAITQAPDPVAVTRFFLNLTKPKSIV